MSFNFNSMYLVCAYFLVIILIFGVVNNNKELFLMPPFIICIFRERTGCIIKLSVKVYHVLVPAHLLTL